MPPTGNPGFAAAIVRPQGELTGERASSFRNYLRPVLLEHSGLILDMADVPFIDSEGLGALVALFKTARLSGRQFALCSLRSNVEALLSITRLSRVFATFEDIETAARNLANGAV